MKVPLNMTIGGHELDTTRQFWRGGGGRLDLSSVPLDCQIESPPVLLISCEVDVGYRRDGTKRS